MGRKRKKKANQDMKTQIKGILLIALAVFCYLGLVQPEQTGGIGLFVSTGLQTLAGQVAVIVPFFIGIFGLRKILPEDRFNIKLRLIGLLILLLLAMTWIHLNVMTARIPTFPPDRVVMESFMIGFNGDGGGIIGAALAIPYYFLLGQLGSRILIFAVGLIAILMVLDVSMKSLFNFLFRVVKSLFHYLKIIGITLVGIVTQISNLSRQKIEQAKANKKENADLKAGKAEEPPVETKKPPQLPGEVSAPVQSWPGPTGQPEVSNRGGYQRERQITVSEVQDPEKQQGEMPSVVSRKGKSPADYIFPPLDLLSRPGSDNGQQHLKSSKERAKKLENTLQNFGVRAKVTHVQSGPTVTRFEVQPEAGVKVSKIINLSDDLALNMAAPRVRIEAPIPGKAALGIEVPNNVISLVHLREVLEENTFKNSTSPLTVGLGKDITGVPVIADLSKMPHLLIAGATGAGKSVCLNTLIVSILYKVGPDQLRFMMIDPKVVELSVYNGIPHLLMPVLTEPRKASLALRNMVKEMGRRYDLFARLGVRDINAYNEMAAVDREMEKLPYIVVVIDELADLMHVSPGETEDAIARLSQMSRAAGIHLLVATQRPSVDVLTGIIKANITSRIAFNVSSQFDSRTILDAAGAEKLLGRGDMLFYPVGAVKPFRVQGAFVSENEVKNIADFIQEQGVIEEDDSNTFLETPEEVEEEEADALFAEAVDVIVRTGQASISLLQRRFRIGYTRAARLIDDLERRGIVGPFEGSKPREVLVTQEQAERICEELNQEPD
ncbi:MAG: DNA translocase FtsK [Bacillota bacterium]